MSCDNLDGNCARSWCNCDEVRAKRASLALGTGSPPLLRYTEEDSERANHDWKATCGPHAIAAALGLTLNQVRPVLANYKGWMSPTQMSQALVHLGAVHGLTHHLKTDKLCDGINRVQWEGKWLNPGVPARVAYFHTHWVAHFGGWVLCTACEAAKWIRADDWRHFHLECEPRSPFHVTHHYVLTRPHGLGVAGAQLQAP